MQLHVAILATFAIAFSMSEARAQNPPCRVTREPFVNGGIAKATMALDQDGVCTFRFRFGGQRPPDTWEIIEAPKSGSVVFNSDVAEYKPNATFSGQDRFVIAIFGIAPGCALYCTRNGRYEVTVAVQPKS